MDNVSLCRCNPSKTWSKHIHMIPTCTLSINSKLAVDPITFKIPYHFKSSFGWIVMMNNEYVFCHSESFET